MHTERTTGITAGMLLSPLSPVKGSLDSKNCPEGDASARLSSARNRTSRGAPSMLNCSGGPGLPGILASNTRTTGSPNSSVGADVSYGLSDLEVMPTDTIWGLAQRGGVEASRGTGRAGWHRGQALRRYEVRGGRSQGRNRGVPGPESGGPRAGIGGTWGRDWRVGACGKNTKARLTVHAATTLMNHNAQQVRRSSHAPRTTGFGCASAPPPSRKN